MKLKYCFGTNTKLGFPGIANHLMALHKFTQTIFICRNSYYHGSKLISKVQLKYMRRFIPPLLLCLLLFIFSDVDAQNYSYLALGDSYTIGEKVDKSQRWPVQLVDSLQERGIAIEEPRIIAKTGWTTTDLLDAIEKQSPEKNYDLVTLLIGVNNQYQGKPIQQYRREFTKLLNKSISFANGNTERVFVVSIPDYGVTPFGQQKDPEKIAEELTQYNEIARTISEKNGITFINITPISLQAKTDSSLIAEDDLHPSGKMYQQWMKKIIPKVINRFQ